MKFLKCLQLAAAPALLALAAPAQVSYELESDSSYTQGCYPPCLCPIFLAESFSGTFDLEFVNATADGFAHYALTNIDWSVRVGSNTLSIVGAGTYSLGGQFALLQRLELDLATDGGELEHFDSGLLPASGAFPEIDISLSMNDMFCFDKVLDLSARPAETGTPYCDAAPNSAGLIATTRATGSPVVLQNDLTLVTEMAPPRVPGLYFFGAGQTSQPFGDGILCVNPPLIRIQPPVGTDAAGAVSMPFDTTSFPASLLIAPGTTWNFQFWYRDLLGGPAGFNLSDAYEISFL